MSSLDSDFLDPGPQAEAREIRNAIADAMAAAARLETECSDEGGAQQPRESNGSSKTVRADGGGSVAPA